MRNKGANGGCFLFKLRILFQFPLYSLEFIACTLLFGKKAFYNYVLLKIFIMKLSDFFSSQSAKI